MVKKSRQFCSSCAAKLSPGDSFCPECGVSLKGKGATVRTAPKEPPVPRPKKAETPVPKPKKAEHSFPKPKKEEPEKDEKQIKPASNKYRIILLIVVISVAGVFIFSVVSSFFLFSSVSLKQGPTPVYVDKEPGEIPQKWVQQPITLHFYVMSQCPFGIGVENTIAPVLEKFGPAIDFQLDFIANDLGNGNFWSLHGESEVNGDIAQLCAKVHEPEQWMSLVICMNKDANAIPANWRTCSAQLGLDTKAIGDCYAGEEGKKLLSASIARSSKVGAQGSPTMYLNGNHYTGNRESADFIRAICQELGDHPECTR